MNDHGASATPLWLPGALTRTESLENMTVSPNAGSSTVETSPAAVQKYSVTSRCFPGFISESTFLLRLMGECGMNLTIPCFSNHLCPYPKELKETFPIGPSEIPEWDDAMVRQGCRGIKLLIESHPDSRFVVSCNSCWERLSVRNWRY